MTMDDQRLIEIKESLEQLHDDVSQLKGLIVPAHIPGGAKGVLERVAAIEVLLRGDDRNWGLVTEHKLMWKSWLWILCTASAGAGALLTWIVTKFV